MIPMKQHFTGINENNRWQLGRLFVRKIADLAQIASPVGGFRPALPR